MSMKENIGKEGKVGWRKIKKGKKGKGKRTGKKGGRKSEGKKKKLEKSKDLNYVRIRKEGRRIEEEGR